MLGEPDDSTDTYKDSDGGTANLQLNVTKASSAAPESVSENVGGQDTFAESEQGTDGYEDYPNSDDPLAPTLNGSGGASGLDATQSTGNDKYQVTQGGGETFSFNQAVNVAGDGTLSWQRVGGSASTQENVSESDSGTGGDASTVTGNASAIDETYQDQSGSKRGPKTKGTLRTLLIILVQRVGWSFPWPTAGPDGRLQPQTLHHSLHPNVRTVGTAAPPNVAWLLIPSPPAPRRPT